MDLDESLERRYAWRKQVEDRGLIGYELETCAANVAHWFNTYVFTYDPRSTPSVLPFDLFPRQAEYLAWLEERERTQTDGLTEKSRDAGASYLATGFALHRWLFKPGFSAGFGSRKLELVDKIGDPDSLFEKIRVMLYSLPPWFFPRGFLREQHDNMARLVNPENGATITGEGGDNIGRGGRKSMYFVDEAAFLEHPKMVERALSQTTRCRIDISTPHGMGNPFYQKRHGGQVSVFTFHWRQDPRKDESWYAEQKRRFDAVTVAQEIDLDYTASIEGICIPAAWVRAAVNLVLPGVDGQPYVPHGPVVAGLDVGETRDLSVFQPRQGPVVRMPKAWNKLDTTQTAWRADELCREEGVEVLNYDSDGVGAGVKGTLNNSDVRLPYNVRPLRGGAAPTGVRWNDGRTSAEKFINLRAELWGLLRQRFEKTFEYVTQGVEHPAEEMITLPDCPELTAELSLPLRFNTASGKIKLESKDDMRKRGVASPNYADALAYSEVPGGDFDAPSKPPEPEKRSPFAERPNARTDRLGGLFGGKRGRGGR